MEIRLFVILTAVAYTYQEETATENPTTTTATAARTSFSCEGRVTGYYADVETGCRTYHYCIGSQQYTYECPNNTLFQQRIFICNHWYLVDCGTSEQFYNANLLIGQRDKPFVGEGDAPLPPTHSVAYPTTERSVELRETTYRDDYEEAFSVPDAEDIQRVETTTRATATTTAATTARATAAAAATETFRDGKSNDGNGDERFIRLKFADPRGLFYIPNDNNSVEGYAAGFREFVIPRFLEADVMQFKVGGSEAPDVSCPKYCDLRYVRPGTCHPCIMIK